MSESLCDGVGVGVDLEGGDILVSFEFLARVGPDADGDDDVFIFHGGSGGGWRWTRRGGQRGGMGRRSAWWRWHGRALEERAGAGIGRVNELHLINMTAEQSVDEVQGAVAERWTIVIVASSDNLQAR